MIKWWLDSDGKDTCPCHSEPNASTLARWRECPVSTALDHPDCRACQMWEDAGASWPRPCAEHYGGEADE